MPQFSNSPSAEFIITVLFFLQSQGCTIFLNCPLKTSSSIGQEGVL